MRRGLKPLRYGLFKRSVDRRAGARDGRSGSPDHEGQPEPTSYVKRLLAEFVEQAAAEHESRDRDTAPWRRGLAGLTVDIQDPQHAPTIEQQQPSGAQQTTATGVHRDPDVEAWRQQDIRQKKQQLKEIIANREKQCLDRQNQLAAHTWVRIETYWARLVQIHPDGESLNGWINEWKPARLAGPLEMIINLHELNRRDQSVEAIKLSESD